MTSYLLPQRWKMTLFLIVIAILFSAAFVPAIGVKAAPWHIEIHFLTYAIVGVITYWTLSELAFYLLYSIITMIPVAHEICEIWGHHHHLEIQDIIINLIGMGTGTFIAILTQKKVKPLLSREK
ncbi:hypothetical protein [Vibrio salinus]|uniref:hypothetical protein n=1 Tax=Vibrio salinus TaxID=2899784 RepID=UPI001E39505B|nr:hypothetical protein [Vibrio salinus]MCE0492897.1 hypothetical protein [Vibrio salinus]